MIFNSIRWRLQIWHGLILVVVLAGFGLTAYQVARDNQLRRIDHDLEQRLMSAFRPGPPDPGPRGQPPMDRPSPDRSPPERGPSDGSPPERSPPDGYGPDGPRREPPGGRRDPVEVRARMTEAIARAVSADTGETNAFYYVVWQQDGKVVAHSAGAPGDVPMPERPAHAGPDSPPGPEAPGGNSRFGPGQPMPPVGRTRGELREVFRFAAFGDCVLVGRSLGPDLAAMRRLGLWLSAAGAGILVFGLAGGWWVAGHAIRPIKDISATAVKIAGGDLSQRINAADTESELGHLAGVLNSTFARLEAAFAQQARFTSDASHELRTPVAVILSQTQSALSRERASGEYREALEACRRAAQRMRGLTESLLELARLDAGQEPMKRQRFDLARVAQEGADMVRPLATERGIELCCELPAVEAVGDGERIGQVVTNLLMNAIQFNRPQGQVRLTARAENGSALLTVADTGQGISAEDLPHVFERFFRGDKSRSGAQGHAGLGLAICKAIVDAQGGAIEVSSEPGVGSRFTLKLPVG